MCPLCDRPENVCECGCYLDRRCSCARDCANHPGGNDAQLAAANKARRAALAAENRKARQ
jgi:hypothetical protein